MTNPSRGLEEANRSTIDEWCDPRTANAGFDPSCNSFLKAHSEHDLTHKEMIDLVEGVPHIQLDCHTLLFVLQAGMDSFLDDDYIIHDLSARNESSLSAQDDFSHDIFHSSGKNFGKNFVGGVT